MREPISQPGRLLLTFLVLLAAAACTGEVPASSKDGLLGGRVLLAPGVGLAGATVSVDQLDLYDGKAEVRRRHLGEARTDEHGFFEPIPTGALAGLFLLRSSGGTYRDPISGATIRLDPSVELRALHLLNHFEDRSATIYLTPIHALVEARFRQQIDSPGTPDEMRVTRTLEDSYTHINAHFGGLDWERVIPAEVDEPALSPTDELRAAFVLGGFAVLSDDLRGASNSTPQAVNLITLLQSAVQDLQHDAVFDGNDGNDRTPGSGLQVGTCPPVDPLCATPPRGCQLGACRAPCDTFVSSYRASLVGAIRKYLGPREAPSEWNRTTLGSEDLRPMLEAIGGNDDVALFGSTCLETADRVAPSIIWYGPQDGAFLKGSVPIKIRAADDGEALPVASFVDLLDTDLSASFAVALLDTYLVGDGDISVTAVARDSAGNQRRDTRTFHIDNTAPALSVAPAGFLLESPSGIWWTAESEPVLTGTFDELHPRAIEILIAGEVAATAALSGNTWSVRLPSGKVTASGNEVSVRAVDLAGNTTTSAAVQLRLDATPPSVLVESSPVYDELSSTESYDQDHPETNLWIQSHVTGGTPIDLAQSMSGACATLHKFSHLLHENFILGSAGTLNPIKTSFAVSDDGVGIEPGTAQARLTIRNGPTVTEVLPWIAIPGTAIGPKATRHLLGLYRDGALAIPSLATTEGEYHLELRARDKLGRTSLQERCWHHRILAPRTPPEPLPDNAGALAVGFPQAMYSTSLDPNGAQFGDVSAKLLSPNSAGVAVWIWKVKNYLATPIYVTVDISRGASAKVTRTFQLRNGLTNHRATNTSCGASPCTIGVPQSLYTGTAIDVPHPNLKLRARFFQMNGEVPGMEIAPCAGCANDDEQQIYMFEIPARATPQGVPLVEHAVITYLRPTLPAGDGTDVTMAPSDTASPDTEPGPYREFSLGGQILTGKLVGGLGVEVCTAQELEAGQWRCVEKANRQRYRVLTSVKYNWDIRMTSTYTFSATRALPRRFSLVGALENTRTTAWVSTETSNLP